VSKDAAVSILQRTNSERIVAWILCILR
jgi:hypothetical protein